MSKMRWQRAKKNRPIVTTNGNEFGLSGDLRRRAANEMRRWRKTLSSADQALLGGRYISGGP